MHQFTLVNCSYEHLVSILQEGDSDVMGVNRLYAPPQMLYVGKATDVVRGWGGVGPDVSGEEIVVDMEFAADEPSVMPSQA